MTETKFETLTAFLSAWFDRPKDELPAEVLSRINQDLFGLWDLLNEGQRRSVAAQWDAQHDPAYEDERAREWDLACRLQAVKGGIKKWLLMNPKSITEAEIQESKLKPLREQAAQLEAELDALAEDDQSQETAPAAEITPPRPAPAPQITTPRPAPAPQAGVAKSSIIGAFVSCGHFTEKKLERTLGDANRTKWLRPARVFAGAPGTSALWNPAQLAMCICDHFRATPQQRHDYARIIKRHFPEYLPEWQEYDDTF